MATIVNKLQNVTTAVAAMAMVTFVCLSCDHQQQTAKKQTEADSIIMAAYDGRDYECAIALCDSLEQAGDISKIRAALFRDFGIYARPKTRIVTVK